MHLQHMKIITYGRYGTPLFFQSQFFYLKKYKKVNKDTLLFVKNLKLTPGLGHPLKGRFLGLNGDNCPHY